MLRVDELRKAAGVQCPHQTLPTASGEKAESVDDGCGIYATRPAICRGYRCLWLQGGLEDDERPDQTGGIVDLEARGASVALMIAETEPGSFDASEGLQRIVARYREEMPVRVIAFGNEADPDRPFRVFEANGVERRVDGEWVETLRDGISVGRARQPWAERLARRLAIRWRRKKVARLLDPEI